MLLAYCARRLDADSAAWLERHIASCPACAETYRAQAAVWQALDEWEGARISPDFDRRLYRAIDERFHASWWARFSRGMQPLSIYRGLPLAAAACLLVMAGLIVNQRGDLELPEAHETVQIETVAVDQVERTLEDMELLHNFSMEMRAEAQANSL